MSAPWALENWPLRLAAAAGVVLMSWLLAGTLRWFLRKAAGTERWGRLLSRSGLLAGLFEPSLDELRRVAGGAAYWIVMLTGFAAATSILSESAATEWREIAIVHVPKLLGALVVFWAFHWLAGYWSRSALVAAANAGIPCPWTWAAVVRGGTIFAGIALASESSGVATALVRSAFLIVLAGSVLLCVLVLAPLFKAHLMGFETKVGSGPDETCR